MSKIKIKNKNHLTPHRLKKKELSFLFIFLTKYLAIMIQTKYFMYKNDKIKNINLPFFIKPKIESKKIKNKIKLSLLDSVK